MEIPTCLEFLQNDNYDLIKNEEIIPASSDLNFQLTKALSTNIFGFFFWYLKKQNIFWTPEKATVHVNSVLK